MGEPWFIAAIWLVAGAIGGYLLGCRLTDYKWMDNARRNYRLECRGKLFKVELCPDWLQRRVERRRPGPKP